jgi:predicted metal-binding membrane protein
MLLLFVGGVMNLWWISALTIFVVLEKLTAHWSQGPRLSGVMLLVAGVWILRHCLMA